MEDSRDYRAESEEVPREDEREFDAAAPRDEVPFHIPRD